MAIIHAYILRITKHNSHTHLAMNYKWDKNVFLVRLKHDVTHCHARCRHRLAHTAENTTTKEITARPTRNPRMLP